MTQTAAVPQSHSIGEPQPIVLPLEQQSLDVVVDGNLRVRRTVLPGGTRVLTEQIPGAHSTTIGFWVPVGSRDEREGFFGSTHFLEHLLFKGTGTRSALDIAVAFDAVGGESNALTAKEHTCYYAKVRDADVPMAVNVLADMVTGSVLDSEEFDRERQVILEELAMSDDDPTDVVHEQFSSLVFADSPLGRPIGGTPESITAVSRDAVWDHYRASYRADDVVVTAAGVVDHDALVAAVDQALRRAGWASSPSAPCARRSTELAPGLELPTRSVRRRDSEQVHIVLGSRGLAMSDDRRPMMSVLNTVLGGGMSSRLFQEVRERRGLAYSVYSFAGAYSDAGSFGMYAGTRPGQEAQVGSLMRGVLEALAMDGPSEDELERAKGQIAGSITLAFEDSNHHMTRLGGAELGIGELRGLDVTLARIGAVTVAGVRDLAAELIGAPLQVSAVGPVDEAAIDALIG